MRTSMELPQETTQCDILEGFCVEAQMMKWGTCRGSFLNMSQRKSPTTAILSSHSHSPLSGKIHIFYLRSHGKSNYWICSFLSPMIYLLLEHFSQSLKRAQYIFWGCCQNKHVADKCECRHSMNSLNTCLKSKACWKTKLTLWLLLSFKYSKRV